MVDYVSTNALSMLGGDDFSDITASIAVLDASVVHKTGNLTESINGLKTFTDNLVVNNTNTTITATGTATDGVINLIATDPTSSGLYGQVKANGATKVELVSGSSSVNIFPTALSVVANGQIDLTSTATNINTGFIRLYDQAVSTSVGEIRCDSLTIKDLTGATTKMSITSILTTNKNTTITESISSQYKIQNQLATPIDMFKINSVGDAVITAGTFTLNSTGSASNAIFTINSPVVDLGIISMLAYDTSITGTTLGLTGTFAVALSGATYTLNCGSEKQRTTSILTTNTNATITNVGTTAFKVQSVAGTDKLIITPIATTDTNATITNVATTAFQVQSVAGTNKINVLPASTTISDATITNVATTAFKVQGVAGTDIITTTAGTQVTINPTTTLQLRINSSDVFLANGTATTLTGANNLNLNATAGAGVVTMNISGSAKETHTSVLSTFANSTINNIASTAFKVQNILGTDKVNVGSALTTLTNTDIDLTGQVNANTYNIGTSTSNLPLLTHQLHCSRLLSNQAIGTTNYYCNFGSNSATNTCIATRLPLGRLIPKYCVITFDNGTFTGGGTVTLVVTVINATTGITSYTATSAIIISSFSVTSVLAMTENVALTSGSAVNVSVSVTSTVAITLSTKNMYIDIHSQQV